MKNILYSKLYFQILMIIITGMIIVYLNQNYIYTHNLYYKTLALEMTHGQIDQLLEGIRWYRILGYFIYFILILLKFLVLALILQTVMFLSGHKADYQIVLRAVVVSEIVFLVAGFIKFIWFFYFSPDFTFNDVNRFSPLSLAQLAGPIDSDSLWLYPLQVINLFELFFMLLTGWLIKKELPSLGFDKALEIVVIGYLPVLTLWVAVLLFIRIILTA